MVETKAGSSSEVATDVTTEQKKEHGVLYIGMDLGTSRTSISCSNGIRETVASVIGYPKDVVSRKHLQKDVLFGQEAFDNRLAVEFYRPLAQGVIKGTNTAQTKESEEANMNMKAAEDLVQHAVKMATPRADELLYGVIGCPAQASIHNRKAIIDSARDLLDSVMICSEPFAVAYGLDRLSDVLVIDIGAGTTDLCRMHGTMPGDGDQITISYAGDLIDQKLLEAVTKRYPNAQVNSNMVRQWKERWASVRDRIEPIKVMIPVNGKPTEHDITDEIRTSCRTIVPPIVEGLAQLIATFDPEFQDRLKSNVLLGGGGSQIGGLGDEIEKEMERRLGSGTVTTVEEPIYAGANGALKIAHDMPEEFWERLK